MNITLQIFVYNTVLLFSIKSYSSNIFFIVEICMKNDLFLQQCIYKSFTISYVIYVTYNCIKTDYYYTVVPLYAYCTIYCTLERILYSMLLLCLFGRVANFVRFAENHYGTGTVASA